MELLVATAVGALTAGGIYLTLRKRAFTVIIGLALLSYAVNVFLFASGGLAVDMPPILSKYGEQAYTDPLPQALVLTAIVISFGMTAVLVMVSLGAYFETQSDRVDMDEAPEDVEENTP
ncbi:Na+/H+ antiporter subunit C [Aliishimia ponticola]|uniref:Na+/H+ antiporter subunit C n=1 Tax=Aliishimia ponticola TaxID=2499833 RepID=A0A4S4NC84_9RHOB|nr:Na+/H+ antiporter subunit C [Aliishimia ponticola]THH37036.1 Na+/H+ antiporter subunit C [Aliishimia ponticola]